ncbi:hypothetical protein ONE63_007321 [Megalurothrips usitatus]|uniref:Uncharacterized protein n=1 Tax=Megalurothrips usitatus TaxID=439358 RepID=A0AAV7XV58_9NEOP|nr:hypothetical protein ONE63_007321 [Megalurothrips usitatus]
MAIKLVFFVALLLVGIVVATIDYDADDMDACIADLMQRYGWDADECFGICCSTPEIACSERDRR